MGCNPSKAEQEAQIPDAVESPTKESPVTPSPDPRLPLSARDVFRLKKSWKGIKRQMELTGVEVFVRMFRKNASLQGLFQSFANVGSDSLRENRALEAHATVVMTKFDEMFLNIDNLDHVINVCETIKASHSIFRGFAIQLFWNMEEPFLGAIQITLGDACNEDICRIYSKALHFILEHLTDPSTLPNSPPQPPPPGAVGDAIETTAKNHDSTLPDGRTQSDARSKSKEHGEAKTVTNNFNTSAVDKDGGLGTRQNDPNADIQLVNADSNCGQNSHEVSQNGKHMVNSI